MRIATSPFSCTGNRSEEIMASSNLKRKLEFDNFDVSEIGEEIHSGALVHDRVIEMSPIKNSRKNKHAEDELRFAKSAWLCVRNCLVCWCPSLSSCSLRCLSSGVSKDILSCRL